MTEIIDAFFIINLILVTTAVLKHKLNFSFLSLSYYYIVVFVFIGSYFAIGSNDFWLRDVSDQNIIEAFYITNIYVFIHSLVLLRTKPYQINLPTSYIAGIELYIFPTVLILSLLFIMLFLFPSSALKALLIDGNTNALILAELRGSSSVLVTESKLMLYFKNIILRYFVPFIFIYYTLLYFKLNRFKAWFYVSLLAVIITSLLTLAKGPIVNVLILILMIRIILGHKINLMKYIFIAFSILIPLYIFVMGAENIVLAIESIFHRIFMAQYFGFPMSLEVFPRTHDYLGFSGLSGMVSKLLGMDYHSFSRIIMEFGNEWGVEAGTAGYMSTFYLAEGHAYAGMFGIILVSFLVLLLFYRLDMFTKTLKSNFLNMSLLILVMFTLGKSTIDSFSSIVLNYSLYMLIVFVISLNVFNRKFKKGSTL